MKHFSFNQSFIKSILVVVLTVCSLQMWGATATFTAGTDKGETSVTKGGVTVSMSTMSRDDNYRTYASSSMTVSGATITQIDLTCTGSGTSNYGPGKFSGTGYSYSGTAGTWSGSSTSVSLSASTQVRMTQIVVTFKAKVTFDANGGSCDPEYLVQSTPTSTITLPTPTRAGFTCTGWYTEASAGTKRGDAGDTYTPTGSETLYAQWTSGGGEPTLSSISVKTAPTKTSYTAGEFFDPTGLVITRTYSDASTSDYTYADHTSEFSFLPSLSTALTTSNVSVSITYSGKSTSQAITVASGGGGGGGSCDVFSETWNGCDGTGGNSGGWSGSVASGTDITSDNAGWTYSTGYEGDKCIRTNKAGYVRTPSISVTNGTTYTLSYKAADWGSDGCSFTLSATGATITEGASSGALSSGSWGDYSATLTATASSMQITFTASSGDRGWLDEICIGSNGPIKVTSSFTEFTYVLGSGPSASQTFKVQGTDLEGNLTITAPTNYQISQNGSSWSNSITLNKDGDDDVAETTLYIRLNADLAKGEYDGDITFSDGTNDKTVAVEGSVTITCSTPSISFTEATVNKYRGDADFKIDPNVSGNTLGATISWASDKESCATVGSDGTVHILKANGAGAYVRITATLNAKETAVACQNEVSAYYDIYIKNMVIWLVNNTPYTTGGPTTEVTEGAKITTAPTDPDGSTMCGGKTFVGWTTSEVAVEQATAPSPLYSSTTVKNINIENNFTFYAVFAESGGESEDKYRKGTSSDLTNGKRVLIVHHSTNNALSSDESGVGYAGVSTPPDGSGIITTTNSKIIWTAVPSSSGCAFRQGDNYILADESSGGNHYLYFDNYADEWTLTDGSTSGTYILHSSIDVGYQFEYYSGKFQTYTGSSGAAYEMDFYVPDVGFTAYTTACGPSIKANEVEHLTSYKDQTVRSDSIVVRGSSLTADGTLTPSITGTDAGLFECTLASNAISAAGAIESKFVIRYTPTAFGDAQHTATLTFSDGTTTSDPITLNGRSLPEEFAIVAYDGAQYYVLDGTMTGSASLVKALPVTIETGAVKLCPTQAVYSLTERATPDQYVHLVGPTGRRLYGEGSKTGLNTHTAGSTDGTGWLLATSDFNTYHITNATTTNRGIMLSNGTKTVFGHYKTSNYGTSGYYGDIQLLPITAKCTCLPEPAVTCVAKATKATLSWEAVEGATEYEITCSGGTVTSPVTGLTATITGLTESTNYTYSVKAVATGTDCSLYHYGAFTTTNCDDVPYDIFTTPGVHSVTVKWKMEAANATIRIYTDEECNTQFGSDHTGLTSPATIEGLNENTTYYFKIWADNYCVSATETFITNSTSVEIVEWFTDSIRIIIDAGADASVIIEDKKEHGSETGNVADKLFISKYFEADGNNKMVAIYNGTVDTIDITDMWFKHSNKGTSETKFCLKNFGKKPGKIAPNEEIIIMRYSSDTDPAKTCAEKEDNYDEWNIIHDGDTDGKGNDIYAWLCFSGPQSIGLYDGSTNKFIDVIGATTNNSGTGSLVQIRASNSTHCSYTEKSANDGSGFYADGKEVETGNDILLSTNRCLLIRKNTVKSGDDAVANNVYTPQEDCSAEIGESFTTLGSEWMGYVIGKGAGAATKTCEGLAYVGGFDYQGYYTTYDSISGLKDLTGNQNPDGTYTIPIDSLDTLACTMMRIKVYEGGVEKASREYKIPIMVEGNKTTKDTIFINDNPNQLRTYNTCKECDVLILKGATLTKASHLELKDQDTINNLTIYPGGKFIVPEGDNYKYAVNSIHFRVQGEETPIVKLKGKVTTHDGQITVSRRITNDRYYFFSLPYDCDVSDIRWSNGEVPTRGADYEIIEYDAATRAVQGSAKGAPGHWKPAGSTLHAGVGYCVAVSSAYIKELMFPMSIGGTDEDLTNKEDTKTTNKVTLERHTGSSSINNHNWNLIAHPYVSPFDAYEDGKITAGWLNCVSPETETEDAVWEYVDDTHVYLTMPSFGASKTTYTQTVSSSITTLNPFLAVFVQAVSAGDLTFDKNHRQLNAAPARHLAAKAENEDESIFVGVTLSGNGQSDQTNVRIRPDFTDEYQLGYDLQKFTTFYTSRPQIYMKPADLQLAFQAVNDDKAKNTWMPMGVYCYEPGTFTFALSEDYPIDEVEAVYLYDKTTGTTTNLLYDTYTITTSKQLYSNTRFALNVIVNRRAPQITTDINAAGAPENMVRKILINGHVFIQRGKDIYDVTGKQVENF